LERGAIWLQSVLGSDAVQLVGGLVADWLLELDIPWGTYVSLEVKFFDSIVAWRWAGATFLGEGSDCQEWEEADNSED
jgi:hypothetical protein